MNRNLQKEEAVKRIKLLKLHQCVEDSFLNEELLQSIHSFLFELEPDNKDKIRKWERKTGNIVYHVINNTFEFGECLSLLYVSKYEEEWSDDKEILKEGYPIVFVMNLDNDDFSEYGSIGIKESMGGLLRTA